MFIIFSGVSGSGKQTIINALMEEYEGSEFVKSATTRPQRPGEDNHYHISAQEFALRQKNNEFFESENVHGNMYGILKADLQKVVDNPDKIFFKDIEVKGTANVCKYLKGKTKVLTFFIECPDEILQKRLAKRGESEESIKIRLSRGDFERQFKNKYDYVVENIDLDEALNKIKKIIKKEHN